MDLWSQTQRRSTLAIETDSAANSDGGADSAALKSDLQTGQTS